MASERDLGVGISVSFRYGSERAGGVIAEDRGPIGRGGRHLYRIKFQLDFTEASFIELPADELQVEHHTFR